MRYTRDTNRAKRTRRRTKRIANLFGLRGSDIDRAARIHKLGLVQLVIAAHQYKRDLIVEHVDERLDLPIGCRASGKCRQVLDRVDTGCRKLFGCRQSLAIIYISEL